MPTNKPITIKRRDDNELTFTITNEADVVQDLSNDEVTLTVKTNKLDPDSLAILQRVYVLDDAPHTNGQFVVQLSYEDSDIVAGTYFYDIQWKRIATGNSEIITPLEGSFTVSQDVTHAT